MKWRKLLFFASYLIYNMVPAAIYRVLPPILGGKNSKQLLDADGFSLSTHQPFCLDFLAHSAQFCQTKRVHHSCKGVWKHARKRGHTREFNFKITVNKLAAFTCVYFHMLFRFGDSYDGNRVLFLKCCSSCFM